MNIVSCASRIRFSIATPLGDRVHYLAPEDIEVVLSRLPAALYERLRVIRFNDRSWGAKFITNHQPLTGEITFCALPERISLSRFLRRGESPCHYGAMRGVPWPSLSVRRFLLYEGLLRGLGCL